jgi:hypothetical protein
MIPSLSMISAIVWSDGNVIYGQSMVRCTKETLSKGEAEKLDKDTREAEKWRETSKEKFCFVFEF